MKRDDITTYLFWVLLFALIIVGLTMVLSAAFGFTTPVDRLAFAGLIANIILVPSVLIGFWSTQKAFRQSQAKPVLKLQMEVTEPHVSKVFGEATDLRYVLQVAAVNHGDAVCLWYMLKIDLPPEVFAQRYYGYSVIVGDGTNWKTIVNAPTTQEPGELSHTFLSNGQFAVYPQWPLILLRQPLVLHPKRQYPKSCLIPYTIVSDRGDRKTGKLVLNLEELY